MNRLTDGEVMELLRSDSPLNKARRILSSFAARMEQSQDGPIELRRLEFEAVAAIALVLQSKPIA